MTVSLPDQKRCNVLELCQTALSEEVFSVRFVLHIIGTLNSYCVAIDYSANHLKQLESDQIRALKNSRGNFDAQMKISESGKQDLIWWQQHVTNSPDFTLSADASMLGWGAVMGQKKVQSEREHCHFDLHINVKELLAVRFELQELARDKEGCVIHILSDNSTTVAHINKMGGVKSEQCR